MRSCGIIAGAVAAVALAACGGGQNQAAGVRPGKYPVAVTSADFATSQTLSQSSRLVIAVRNTGRHVIPDVAVTICNVTCRSSAPAGEGSSAPAFGENSDQPNLSDPAQAVWVVERAPGVCGYNCDGASQGEGGAQGGSGVTADNNTWALGRLRPGHTATFTWTLTAVQPGRHVVAWEVAGDLYGKARAVLAGGGQPGGTFAVDISQTPPNTYVNNSGQIVDDESP